MRCIPLTEEVYDTSPVYCPGCCAVVDEMIWAYQGKYYCRESHVPRSSSAHVAPRTPQGRIDWTHYYEGFYGRSPGHVQGQAQGRAS